MNKTYLNNILLSILLRNSENVVKKVLLFVKAFLKLPFSLSHQFFKIKEKEKIQSFMQLLTEKTVIENIFSYFEIAFHMFFMCFFSIVNCILLHTSKFEENLNIQYWKGKNANIFTLSHLCLETPTQTYL